MEYLRPEDLAKLWHLRRGTIYLYTRRKKNPLPHYHLSKRTMVIILNEAEEWMKSQQ